jgi:anti-anti-sigma regulatory factor
VTSHRPAGRFGLEANWAKDVWRVRLSGDLSASESRRAAHFLLGCVREADAVILDLSGTEAASPLCAQMLAVVCRVSRAHQCDFQISALSPASADLLRAKGLHHLM